jgi:hypothetical protein
MLTPLVTHVHLLYFNIAHKVGSNGSIKILEFLKLFFPKWRVDPTLVLESYVEMP